jgi:phenylpropionate dioxygenase-like ring-hydroxylating dioxygenase large terminal subunit
MTVQIIARDQLVRAKRTMRESSGLLKDYWYVAAQSHQVTAKKPIQRTVLEERIVLYRGTDGKSVALSDRCLHRNAPLSAGVVVDGCIGCPYHGWTYDRTGKCINVPSEGCDGDAPEGLSLESFPTLEQDGLVWVWMGGAGSDIDKAPFRMPFYDTPGWSRYYMETRFENGVTALVENFMDVPHTVFVHRGWFRSRSRKSVGMTVERTADSVLVSYDQPDDIIGFTKLVLNPKGLPMMHTDKFYMPNVTRVDYLFGATAAVGSSLASTAAPDAAETGFVITSQCTPVSPYESLVYTLISYKLGALSEPLKAFMNFYTRRVIEQDVEIMKIHGNHVKNYGNRAYTSTPADTLHVHIEALRDHAESGGHGEKPEPRVDTTTFWI